MRFKGRLVSTTHATALLVAWSLAVPVAAQTGRSHTVANIGVADFSRIRIDNFGQINPTYYRGAQPERRDYATLARLGIKTVIDLQKDGEWNEERRVRGARMDFYRIPMTTRVPPTPEQLALFLKLANDPAAQPVYVHCAGGKHRTGVMTAVYRMSVDGWTAGQAFDEMKDYKFGWDFLHPEFKRFVDAYPDQLLRMASSQAVATAKTN